MRAAGQAMSVGVLHWQKGIPQGGSDPWPLHHGDEFFIIVTPAIDPDGDSSDREIHYAQIEEHDGLINVIDANGDEHAWWHFDEWSYWARITPESLPEFK